MGTFSMIEEVETLLPGVLYKMLNSRTYTRDTMQEWKVGAKALFAGKLIGTSTLAVQKWPPAYAADASGMLFVDEVERIDGRRVESMLDLVPSCRSHETVDIHRDESSAVSV